MASAYQALFLKMFDRPKLVLVGIQGAAEQMQPACKVDSISWRSLLVMASVGIAPVFHVICKSLLSHWPASLQNRFGRTSAMEKSDFGTCVVNFLVLPSKTGEVRAGVHLKTQNEIVGHASGPARRGQAFTWPNFRADMGQSPVTSRCWRLLAAGTLPIRPRRLQIGSGLLDGLDLSLRAYACSESLSPRIAPREPLAHIQPTLVARELLAQARFL